MPAIAIEPATSTNSGVFGIELLTSGPESANASTNPKTATATRRGVSSETCSESTIAEAAIRPKNSAATSPGYVSKA